MNDIRIRTDRPLILAYHSISQRRQDSLAVRPADFEAHLRWFRDHGYQSHTLAQFVNGACDGARRVVLVTFDDGYADNYTLAFPILKRYGFVATIFLVSDYVDTDRTFTWDLHKIDDGHDVDLYKTLTWTQVQEMAAYGIDFGSHTCTHPELTTVIPTQASDELIRSRKDLQRRLGNEIVSFSYPRGALNPRIVGLVESSGYRCAVVTPNRRGIPLGPFTLRRVGIYHNVNPLMFGLKLNPVIRRIYESVRWASAPNF